MAILLVSVIFTNVAPIIKKQVGFNCSYYACGLYSDRHNYAKKEAKDFCSELKNEYLEPIKKEKTTCDRRKAMNGLEYVVSNFNFIFGFVCVFEGFLLLFKIGNLGNDGKYIGLIGLSCGAIGLILTWVYDYPSYKVKIDSDGASLKWNGSKSKYECIF